MVTSVSEQPIAFEIFLKAVSDSRDEENWDDEENSLKDFECEWNDAEESRGELVDVLNQYGEDMGAETFEKKLLGAGVEQFDLQTATVLQLYKATYACGLWKPSLDIYKKCLFKKSGCVNQKSFPIICELKQFYTLPARNWSYFAADIARIKKGALSDLDNFIEEEYKTLIKTKQAASKPRGRPRSAVCSPENALVENSKKAKTNENSETTDDTLEKSTIEIAQDLIKDFLLNNKVSVAALEQVYASSIEISWAICANEIMNKNSTKGLAITNKNLLPLSAVPPREFSKVDFGLAVELMAITLVRATIRAQNRLQKILSTLPTSRAMKYVLTAISRTALNAYSSMFKIQKEIEKEKARAEAAALKQKEENASEVADAELFTNRFSQQPMISPPIGMLPTLPPLRPDERKTRMLNSVSQLELVQNALRSPNPYHRILARQKMSQSILAAVTNGGLATQISCAPQFSGLYNNFLPYPLNPAFAVPVISQINSTSRNYYISPGPLENFYGYGLLNPRNFIREHRFNP
eukprot:GHVL01010843.1.p1 GENE.GHVL01010843.1~~GHVL01010843.1.p1  ORF type:complete len:524 (+),score=90.31 GHVL01010843.1:458-2029(+)